MSTESSVPTICHIMQKPNRRLEWPIVTFTPQLESAGHRSQLCHWGRASKGPKDSGCLCFHRGGQRPEARWVGHWSWRVCSAGSRSVYRGAGAMEELNGGRRGWQTTKRSPEIVSVSLVVLTSESEGGLRSPYFRKLLRWVECSSRLGNPVRVETGLNTEQKEADVSPGFTTCPGWPPFVQSYWLAHLYSFLIYKIGLMKSNVIIVCEPLLNGLIHIRHVEQCVISTRVPLKHRLFKCTWKGTDEGQRQTWVFPVYY